MRRRLSQRGGEGGFSLLEMVVAVALIGLLGLLATETARFSRDGYERGLQSSEALDERRALRRFFSALLAEAEPVSLEDDEGRLAVFFEGDAERLTVLAPYAALAGLARRGPLAALAQRPGLAVLSLGFRRDAGGEGALVLEHAPFTHDAQLRREASGEALLLGPLRDARWRYFGREPEQAPEDAAWREQWRLRENTPLAVSLSIDGGGFRPEAPLVARPRRVSAE